MPTIDWRQSLCERSHRNQKKIGNVSETLEFSFDIVNPRDSMALQCIEIKTKCRPCALDVLIFALQITNNTSSLYLWQQQLHKQRERNEIREREKTINPRGKRARAQCCTCSTITSAAQHLLRKPNERCADDEHSIKYACKRFQFKKPRMFYLLDSRQHQTRSRSELLQI